MGTRSLTVFVDGENEEIAVMYRQFDGYPTGHGQDLLDWGKDRNVVNGFNGRDEAERAFNGMRCAAADCISSFKHGIGDVYLEPTGTRGCGEDYIYTISAKLGRLVLRVECTFDDSVVFEGWLDDFNPREAEEHGSC